MSQDYEWITDEMFQSKLEELADEHSVSALMMMVPNIYAEIREFFTNGVLDGLVEECCFDCGSKPVKGVFCPSCWDDLTAKAELEEYDDQD